MNVISILEIVHHEKRITPYASNPSSFESATN